MILQKSVFRSNKAKTFQNHLQRATKRCSTYQLMNSVGMETESLNLTIICICTITTEKNVILFPLPHHANNGN